MGNLYHGYVSHNQRVTTLCGDTIVTRNVSAMSITNRRLKNIILMISDTRNL